MDALKAAAREILDQCCADLRVTVNGLDAETLARPPAPETSSLATLVRHAASSTRFLLTCAATGHGYRQRYRGVERPAAFEGGSSAADELIALVDGLEEDGRRLIAEIPGDRLDQRVTMNDAADDAPTRAFAFLHAIDHLREHVGHAQLTRQVLSSES